MVMPRRSNKAPLLKHDHGSVTAELAIAMPAVSLVIAITLGAFALQIERMKLVSISAMAARAFARGEPEENVRALVSEMMPSPADQGSAAQVVAEFEVRENMNCVKLSRQFEIAGLGENFFDFSEVQCARKAGL